MQGKASKENAKSKKHAANNIKRDAAIIEQLPGGWNYNPNHGDNLILTRVSL